MKQGEIIPQIDGTRYLYECPRGTIAIDEYADGRREIIRCLGGSGITKRDIREAIEMHKEVLREDE